MGPLNFIRLVLILVLKLKKKLVRRCYIYNLREEVCVIMTYTTEISEEILLH